MPRKRKYPLFEPRATTRKQGSKRRPVYVTPTPNGEIVRARQGPKTIELMSKSDYDAIVLGRRAIKSDKEKQKGLVRRFGKMAYDTSPLGGGY